MRKHLYLLLALLLIPLYVYATDGVSTVEHPAKVNSVATPDKVNTVSGLAAAGGTDYSADANCMGYWDMAGDGVDDETEPDRSGENETLDELAATEIPVTADRPSGYSGSSRDFEVGDAEYLHHAEGGSTDISGANQSLSIVLWLKSESSDNSANMVSKWHTSSHRQYLIYYDTATNELQFLLSDDGDAETIAKSATDPLNSTWRHIACVYNDVDMRIYIDGVLDSNGADNPKTYSAGIFDGAQTFMIGLAAGSTGFDGLIDEVAIFDRALSAAEVLEIKNNGISGDKGGSD